MIKMMTDQDKINCLCRCREGAIANYDDVPGAERDNHHCAMMMAKKVMGGKQSNLTEAYKFFTGQDFQNAHSAMADTQACMTVYFAALDHQKSVAA